MTDLLGSDDDLTGRYLARRATSAGEADLEALFGPAPPAPAPSSAAPPGPAEAKPATTGSGIAATVVAGAKDVGHGVFEAWKQIPGGISDAVHEGFTAADKLAWWLNGHAEDLTGLDLTYDGWNPLRAAAGDKGEVAPAESVTGGFIRNVAQFLTGFIPAFRGAKAAGIATPAVAGAAAGAVADATVQDPRALGLANLVQEHPALANPVAEYLAADPADGEVEARFKKVLEGLGLGVLTEGLFLAVKAVRGAGRAGTGLDHVADTLDPARPPAPGEITPEHLAPLGRPDDPLVRVVPPDEAAKNAGLSGAQNAASEGPAATGGADPAPRAAWPEGFPEVAVHQPPGGIHAKTHPYYAAGKAGDAQSAATFVVDMMDGPTLARIRAVVGDRQPIVVAVRAEESAGRNKIPQMYAAALADRLGLSWEPAIIQTNRTFHTGAGAAHRVVSRGAFDGPVIPGRDYLLVDDHVTMGGTLADLRAYIQSRGGNVIGATTLTSSRPQVTMALAPDRLTELRSRFGPAEDWWRERFGHGFDGLTNGEASYLLRSFRTPDALRNRIAQAGDAGSGRVHGPVDGRAEGGRDVAPAPLAGTGGAAQDLGVPDHIAAKGVAGAAADAATRGVTLDIPPQVHINWSRIAAPEDVQAVIRDTAEAFAPTIDTARRGVRTNEATAEAADALGLSVEDVLKRRRGQPLNAEESFAARQLWAQSADKLLELARVAAGPNAGAVDQYNFRRMLAVHTALQAEVVGARTETARALQQWSMPAGGGLEQARAIEAMLANSGGAEVSTELARRLADLHTAGAGPAAINQAIRKGLGATTMDAVKEIWINGLLSGPQTHIVNTLSNTLVAGQQVYERAVAARIGGTVVEGEATAMAFGLVSGLKDAFRLSWQALRSGESGASLGKVELSREPAVTAKAFGLAATTGPGRVVDFLGEAFRVPGRFLGAEDEFFKTIGYRMELHAQAFRTATAEGRSGVDLGRRVAEIVANPPENLRIAAADVALYSTFTNSPGWVGQFVMKLRNGGGPANPLPFIIPFVKTPVNVARYAFERTPFAPLVSQWRDDVAAGGARRDLALARTATGSAIMALAADYAASGQISGRGPADVGRREALMRQGWQPYSVRIDDVWYSYNRLDPLGMTMGFAADVTETMRRGEIQPEDMDEWQEMMAGGIAAVSQTVMSKTYLRGAADLVQVLSDPKRYGESYVNRQIGTVVPALANTLKRAVDPVQREVNTPLDAMLARLPGLSERLQPRRDLWGREVHADELYGQGYDLLAPVAASAVKDSPIDAELSRLGLGVERIPKQTDFDGVPVNLKHHPAAYDALVRKAGNEMVLDTGAGPMGLRDTLDAMVTGGHPLAGVYMMLSDGPDGMKVAKIRETVALFRDAAKRDVLADPAFADLRDEVEHRKGEQRALKMPVMGAK